MKKSIFHFSFLLPLLLFVLHQFLQKGLGFQLKFADFYLDPFCLSAIGLPLMAIERKKLFKNATFSWLDVVIILLVLIAVSELLFPYLFPERFIADWWDVVAITLGGLWYLCLHPDRAYLSSKTKTLL